MKHLIEKFLFISLLILLLFLGAKSFFLEFNQPKVDWGVSFDPYYTAALGFGPQEVYRAILTDLGVDHIRLSAFWNRIERERDIYDWVDLDWQVEMATENNTKILLTVGRKLPRWPECYEPMWLNHLSKTEREKELLEIIRLTVERYQENNNIIAWQVENEPLVGWFGVCPPTDKEELKKEIALVKSLDQRQIIITDSGELSTWLQTGALTSILGTTIYRVVSNPTIGFWHWPLPPAYYYYKASLIKKITGVEKVIVTELQAEPWSDGPIQDYPLVKQYKSMDIEQFRANIEYVQQAGFDMVYLWGAEWWYWMKEAQGVDDYWVEAKELWK